MMSAGLFVAVTAVLCAAAVLAVLGTAQVHLSGPAAIEHDGLAPGRPWAPEVRSLLGWLSSRRRRSADISTPRSPAHAGREVVDYNSGPSRRDPARPLPQPP